jgi:hypothetical protein
MGLGSVLVGLCLFVLALTLDSCGDDGDGHDQDALGTLAYVVNECRQNGDEIVASQELRIRRGSAEPVTVMQLTSPGLPAVPGFDCKAYSEFLAGAVFVFVGAFQRLGVSPNGTTVVFEVTDDLSVTHPDMLVAPEQEGMFVVRSDGTGLRRIGPASAEPSWTLIPDETSPIGLRASYFPYFNFSPDGRSIVFADRGPGPAQEDAAQVFTRDLALGTTPLQLTRLPVAPPDPVYGGTAVQHPAFFDADTITFATFSNPVDDDGEELNPEGELRIFTVKIDGTQLEGLPVPIPEGAGEIDPRFVITGAERQAIAFRKNDVAVNPIWYFDRVIEAYVHDGGNVLQLTKFRRSDTWFPFFSAWDQRVFFIASSNELGTNPTGNCQIFSIDPTAEDLRQLTQFREGDRSESGCTGATLPGCWVYFVNAPPISSQDAQTGRLVFYSNCDPLGSNPNGGQLFDIKSDGGDLRQLTHTRGVVEEHDDTLVVELPGPFAYGPYE